MPRFYTGAGDTGTTNVLGVGRMGKDSRLIAAIGDTDELNSAIGFGITNISDDRIANMLQSIQNDVFIIGAELASQGSKAKSGITKSNVTKLEKEIESIGATLPELKKFVLPGGSIGAAGLHLARSVCRRAERSVIAASSENKVNPEIIRYLNRLSSLLFVAALHLNKKEGIDELNPTY